MVRPNDIITGINDHLIADSDAFVRVIGSSPVAHPISIDLLRDGKPLRIEVTLRKRQLPVAAVTRESQRMRWGGMLLGPLCF